MAVDSSGIIYLAGSGTCSNGCVPVVFHLETPGGDTNGTSMFVLKLDPFGAPLHITYFGGSSWEYPTAIAVDTNHSVCVVGCTASSNFPVVNALQPSRGQSDPSGVDGFVAKLNSSGSAFLFSTYFGGSGSDECNSIEFDRQGNLLVLGNTQSTNLPTVNALQSTNASSVESSLRGGGGSTGGTGAFVAKFSPAGTSLLYSTYLGGNGEDRATDLAVDREGNAYVAGSTYSTDFPTRNPLQAHHSTNSHDSDVFLTKLSSDGHTLSYSTYLGGVYDDTATTVAVDGEGRAYIAGTTDSLDFPLLNGLGSSSNLMAASFWQSGYHAFLARFSSNGTSIEFSSLLNHPGGDSANRMAIDPEGTIWITGAEDAYLGWAGKFQFNGSLIAASAPVLDCELNQGIDVAVCSSGGIWILGATSTALRSGYLGFPGRSFIARLNDIPFVTNSAPLIRLTLPNANGFWGTNTTMLLAAAAADLGGRVENVQFFANNQSIGIVTNPPYELNWTPASVGSKTLTAIVTDAMGAMSISCPIQINIVSRPANDDFINSTPIFGVGETVTGSLLGASLEDGEPWNRASSARQIYPPPSRTAWWCWQTPTNGAYTVTLEGSDFSPALGVYVGSGLNDLSLVAAQRSGFTDGHAQATFRASAGVIYFFCIGGDNDMAGGVALQIRPAIAPPNDDFQNRILLSGLNPTASGANFEATHEPGENISRPGQIVLHTGEASIWWSWIAPASGVFSISTGGSGYSPPIGVYVGTNLTNLTAVASSDSNSRLLTFSASAGTRYEIAANDSSGVVGNIDLKIAPIVSPPNDAFTNALPLTGGNASATGTTFGATAELSEPSVNGGTAARHSVWYSWSPPVDGPYRVSATAVPRLAVYTGTTLSNLTAVAIGESSSRSGVTLAVFKAVSGVAYWVMVDSPSGTGGVFELAIEAATPPANDDFADRTELSGAPLIISGTLTDATPEANDPAAGSSSPLGSASVWWSWTAPASATYALRWEGSDGSPAAQVFLGSDLTNLIAVSDLLYSFSAADDGVRFEAHAGEVFQIIAADNVPWGAFKLSLSETTAPLRPANDDFTNRLELVGADVQVLASNVGATHEADEPSSCSEGASAWWRWTAPSNGPVTISTRTQGYGPVLSVYVGSELATLAPMVPVSYRGELTFHAQAGTEYQIAAGECSTAGQAFSLAIRPARPPSNDDFTNRISLTGSRINVTGSNVDATSETNEPTSGYYPASVWWSWIAPANGRVTIESSLQEIPPVPTGPQSRTSGGTYFGAEVDVYTGSGLKSLTRIGGATFQAVAGTTYQIRMASEVSGMFTLRLTGPEPPQPAEFISALPLAGGLQFQFRGTAFHPHTLQYSTNFTQWFDQTNIPPMLTQNVFWASPGAGPMRFYRLRSD